MATVKSALARQLATVPEPRLGGGVAQATLDRTVLANDLLAVSRTNQIYFAICFGTVVMVLIGAGFITARFLDMPQQVGAIFGVVGISITGVMAQMVSLWKQKVLADMTLVLCRNLGELELKATLDTLLAKL